MDQVDKQVVINSIATLNGTIGTLSSLGTKSDEIDLLVKKIMELSNLL